MSEIMTYSKKMFDPVHPAVELIDIGDIAHSLSLLCRANGHFPHFYSVAQHCLNCMNEAAARGYSKRIQLGCLLHDASEAYLSDVTRPVKALLPQYLDVEKGVQDAIFDKWISPALTDEERAQIFLIDDEILYFEFSRLMDYALDDEEPVFATLPDVACRACGEIETAFIRAFHGFFEK